MSTIVLRNVKGSPLTFTEMDNNFTNLNEDKLDISTDNYVTTTTAGTVVTFSNVDAYPGRFEVTTADTGGFESGAHHLQVQFDFITSTYFSQVTGHFGLATHIDSTVIGTHIRGNGVIIGTCSNGYVESSDLTGANIMLETWFGGLVAGPNVNIVYPGSDMPYGNNLVDGQKYRVIFDSCVDFNDRKWIRYRIYKKDPTWLTETIDGSTGFWNMLHDTGYWYDSNAWADFTKPGLWFYEVYSPTDPWSITFSDLIINWGPYLGQAEEATAVRQLRTGQFNTRGLFPRSDGFGSYGQDDQFYMTGFDNTQLKTYASNPVFNWSDWCDVNDIRNKLTAAGMSSTTATQVENVLRPLYCIVGQLCKTAKKNGW